MPPRYRLRRSVDFQKARQKGRTQRHAWMLINIVPNDLPNNRYGFVVSKAVGKAVVRNRVRRQLREILRLFHPQIVQGYDVVVVVRVEAVDQPYVALQKTLVMLLNRARIVIASYEGGAAER